METASTKLFSEIGGKINEFKGKLQEELNKEKDEFQKRTEENVNDDVDDLFRDYEHVADKDGITDLLLDTENKDAVEELISAFIEKLEAKLGEEDGNIMRLRKQE